MMEISACPSCASRRMREPGIGDGSVLGLATVSAVCPVCGFQGSPLLFDDQEAYEAFRDDVDHGVRDRGDDVVDDAPDEVEGAPRQEGPREVPAWVQDELDAPASRRGAPATAVLIGGIGLVAMATGVLLALGGLMAIASGQASATRVVLTLAFLVQVLVSVALLRIAVRLWRGGPRPRGSLP